MSDHRVSHNRFARIFVSAARFFVFGLLLILVFALAFTGKAAPNPIEDPVHRVYLPQTAIFHAKPRLISPSNGAALNTLIPTLAWDIGDQSTEAWGCLAVSDEPHPSMCAISYPLYYEKSTHVMSWNLEPGTTYYWRIGAVYNNDYQNAIWSDEWTFKSGSSGKIPSAPKLISPADKVSLSYDQRVFSWSAVPNALEYRMTLDDLNQWGRYFFTIDSTKIDLRNHISGFYQVNHQYQWVVSARNNYAWSPDSSPRTFTLTSVLNSALRSLSEEGLRGIEFIEEQPDGRMRFTIPTVK